tara:strand:+ start:383 stop:928 length:546 start_codon:yes stop_codon:yes gene_type:complete
MTKKKLREKSFFLRQLIKDKNVKEKKIIENLKSIIPTNNEIISGYYPVNSEVNILPFLKFLIKKDLVICLPFIFKANSHLLFKKFKLETRLIDGKYKIKVPDNDDYFEPSIILVPILSFDLNKNRLGYGGGYYDRTISYLVKKKKILTIGIAFDEQQIEKIPSMNHDMKLDVVVTETKIIK